MTLRRKISFIGITVAGIIDIFGSSVFSAILIVIAIGLSGPNQITSMDSYMKIAQLVQTNPLLHLVSFLGGGFFSILAGYIAASIAKHDELLNGALSSLFCELSGICSLLSGTASLSLFSVLLGIVIDPCLGLLGGYLRLLQVKRKNVVTG
jgi:hypothetical protein